VQLDLALVVLGYDDNVLHVDPRKGPRKGEKERRKGARLNFRAGEKGNTASGLAFCKLGLLLPAGDEAKVKTCPFLVDRGGLQDLIDDAAAHQVAMQPETIPTGFVAAEHRRLLGKTKRDFACAICS
jgi:hypothetical protein